MDSLKDLLGSKMPPEAPEIAVIRRFLREEFQSECTVLIRTQQIVIRVKSASLAGALRMRLHELQKLCPTKKRLSIQIG